MHSEPLFRNYIVGSDIYGYVIYDNVALKYRMIIDASGNVGINTTSYSERLTVGGTMRVSENTYLATDASKEVIVGGTTDAGAHTLQVIGNIYNTTTLTTGAPTSGSAKPWRLGEAATVSPTSPNRTIRVEIDGTVYYIHAKTTND